MKVVSHVLGAVLVCEAALMLLPLLCAVIYGEECVGVFGICILICLAAGGVLLFAKPKNRSMYAKEGFVIVALSWIVMSIFGALPLYFSKSVPTYIDALFEIVSGFTTTGASVIPDLDVVPKSIIFWRSFTHWIGGMGVLVFLVALLPLSGGSNFYLIKAESPGPSVSKLVPKVRTTAKILYTIYICMTVVQVILLLLGGLSLFEALTLSFGTAGTGGFGIVNSSIADYSSYVQVVITVFMILFGIDFSLYYLILMKKIKDALSSEELRAYLGIILVSSVFIALNIYHIVGSVSKAFLHSSFQVASIITTTGYSTCDFDKWPEFSKTILVILMFIGACAGSTGGGMKVSRILILFKSIAKEIKIAVHPRRTYKIMVNKRPVEHETVRAVNVFFVSLLVIFVCSLLVVSLDNFGFTTNFTAVATTINNIGPGLDQVGPTCNFSIYSPLSKLVFVFDMLVGRLEVFPVLILFSPHTWKK